MVTLNDLAASKELDTNEMSTVRGGDGLELIGPGCTAPTKDPVAVAGCEAVATWYSTFGSLLPK